MNDRNAWASFEANRDADKQAAYDHADGSDAEWLAAEVDQCERAVSALRASRRLDRSLEMWVATTLRETVRPRFLRVAETHADALTVDDHREACLRIDHIVARILAGGRVGTDDEHFAAECLTDEALPALKAELKAAAAADRDDFGGLDGVA